MQALSNDHKLVEGLLGKAGADLGMILDQPITFHEIRCERTNTRAAGQGGVHVSFRLDVHSGDVQAQGCVLVPLPDAMALAACLMMASEEEIRAARALAEPDPATKDALLEIDNFLASSFDAAARDLDDAVSVQPAGCQGVRDSVRPAFRYEEGEELLLARSKVGFGASTPFELLLMLPASALPPEEE